MSGDVPGRVFVGSFSALLGPPLLSRHQWTKQVTLGQLFSGVATQTSQSPWRLLQAKTYC